MNVYLKEYSLTHNYIERVSRRLRIKSFHEFETFLRLASFYDIDTLPQAVILFIEKYIQSPFESLDVLIHFLTIVDTQLKRVPLPFDIYIAISDNLKIKTLEQFKTVSGIAHYFDMLPHAVYDFIMKYMGLEKCWKDDGYAGCLESLDESLQWDRDRCEKRGYGCIDYDKQERLIITWGRNKFHEEVSKIASMSVNSESNQYIRQKAGIVSMNFLRYLIRKGFQFGRITIKEAIIANQLECFRLLVSSYYHVRQTFYLGSWLEFANICNLAKSRAEERDFRYLRYLVDYGYRDDGTLDEDYDEKYKHLILYAEMCEEEKESTLNTEKTEKNKENKRLLEVYTSSTINICESIYSSPIFKINL
jgi:hypothetical protein